MNKKTLLIEQLNKKMISYALLKQEAIPTSGWIKAIRNALGISMQQLGNKLSITKQSILEMEQRERDGSISIKSLKEFANVMNMKLVYGFVPNDGTLNSLIDRKAKDLARLIVLRTSNTMKLENQQNSNRRIEKAIRERANALKNEMPKILWD